LFFALVRYHYTFIVEHDVKANGQMILPVLRILTSIQNMHCKLSWQLQTNIIYFSWIIKENNSSELKIMQFYFLILKLYVFIGVISLTLEKLVPSLVRATKRTKNFSL